MENILLFVPLFTAITNRLWRGEASIPRWLWYAVMTSLAVTVYGLVKGYHHDLAVIGRLDAAWLLFFLGYAALPWQAMFSAIHGDAPGRKDNWSVEWMQTLAHVISGAPWQAIGAYDYRTFGVIYGTIRALTMLPGIIMLCYVADSYTPIWGLTGLSMGVVYWLGGKFSRHCGLGNAVGVPCAEVVMGWWLGTYMLIVAGSV